MSSAYGERSGTGDERLGAFGGRPSARCARTECEDTRTICEEWSRYKSRGSVASRDRLVSHYMDTHVRPIAARIHAALPVQVELDDLVQQGYLGLIDAMNRFDVARRVRFEAFSRRRISGAIRDWLRSIDTLPRLTRLRAKRLQALEERFRVRHGRPPSAEELSGQLGLCDEEAMHYLREHRPAATVSFSTASVEGDHAGGEGDAMDALPDRTGSDPHDSVERRDLQRWVTLGLCRRDRLIVILYYYEEMTMREIGSALGISESRVSQRLESILGGLRARIERTDGAEQLLTA